jgi:hypothetical protein
MNSRLPKKFRSRAKRFGYENVKLCIALPKQRESGELIAILTTIIKRSSDL